MQKYSMYDVIKTLQTAFLSFVLCIYKSNVFEKFCAQQRLKGKTKVQKLCSEIEHVSTIL